MKASRARYNVVALAISLAVLSYIQRVAISQSAGPIARDLHLGKGQLGLVFGAFGLSYALFELPGVVRLYGAHRGRLECRVAVRDSLFIWSRRSRMLPESDADAQLLATGTRTRFRAITDVGVHSMGRGCHAAVGSCCYRAMRLAMGLRVICEPGSSLVRGFHAMVQR